MQEEQLGEVQAGEGLHQRLLGASVRPNPEFGGKGRGAVVQ